MRLRKITSKQRQLGFTLIELMIVVAIIGILAAVAVPQYQDYVTRSKWAEVYTQIQPLKLAIAECAQKNSGTIAKTCDTLDLLKTEIGYGQLPAPVNADVTLDSGGVIKMAGKPAIGSCTVIATPDNTTNANVLAWVFASVGTPPCNKSKTGVSEAPKTET